MVDGFGNECPYDFKSIKIYDPDKDEYIKTFIYSGRCLNNIIKQSVPTFDIYFSSNGDICDNKIIDSHHIYLKNCYKPVTITNSCFLSNIDMGENYQMCIPGSSISYNKVIGGIDWYEEGAEVGDIWIYDSETEEKFFVKLSELEDYTDSRYIPIGVCCIPSSHDVYGNGSAGVVSLKYMDYSTPSAGNINPVGIVWGQFNVDISSKLPYLDMVNAYNGSKMLL